MPLLLELTFTNKVSSCLLTVPLLLYQAFILLCPSAPAQKCTLPKFFLLQTAEADLNAANGTNGTLVNVKDAYYVGASFALKKS